MSADSIDRIETAERAGAPWQAATIVAVLLAVGALVIATIALNRAHSTPAPRSNAEQLATLSGEVRTLRTELAAAHGEVASAAATLSKNAGAIAKISTCLPELTEEINGLTPEVTGGSVFLSQHKQVSSYCKSTLEGH